MSGDTDTGEDGGIRSALTREEWEQLRKFRAHMPRPDDASEWNDAHSEMARANEALPEGDRRKITHKDADAASDALYALHGPKMDAPRNPLEHALLDLADKLRAILPPERT